MVRADLQRLRVVVHGDYADGTTEVLREQEFPPTCHLCAEPLQNEHGFVTAMLLDLDGGMAFICNRHELHPSDAASST